MDCVKEWLCNNYLLVVGIIVFLGVVVSFFRNKWKRWMFNNYWFLLLLIFLIVIDAAYLATYYGADWEYIIPVAIALASLIYPLLNEEKRRVDSEQDAFDYFYYTLATSSITEEIRQLVEWEIDSNMGIEVFTAMFKPMHYSLKTDFIKDSNYTNLNRFFRNNDLLVKSQNLFLGLETLDATLRSYDNEVLLYNAKIEENQKVISRLERMGDTRLFIIANDKKLNRSFRKSYKNWAKEFNENSNKYMSRERFEAISKKSEFPSLKNYEHVEVDDELLKLINICMDFKERICINKYTKVYLNKIEEEVYSLIDAYHRMDFERCTVTDQIGVIGNDLQGIKNEIDIFVNDKKSRSLISKGLKKQLDEMEKAQTSK